MKKLIQLTKKEQGELIDELIHDQKKQLMDAIHKEAFYQEEQARPTHMGKDKALYNLGEYQKRIKYLEQDIYLMEEYKRTHEL